MRLVSRKQRPGTWPSQDQRPSRHVPRLETQLNRCQLARLIYDRPEIGRRRKAKSSISVQEGQPATNLLILQFVICLCGARFLRTFSPFATSTFTLPAYRDHSPQRSAAENACGLSGPFLGRQICSVSGEFSRFRQRNNRGPGAMRASHAASLWRSSRGVSLTTQRAAGPRERRARFPVRDRRDGRGRSDNRAGRRSSSDLRQKSGRPRDKRKPDNKPQHAVHSPDIGGYVHSSLFGAVATSSRVGNAVMVQGRGWSSTSSHSLFGALVVKLFESVVH